MNSRKTSPYAFRIVLEAKVTLTFFFMGESYGQISHVASALRHMHLRKGSQRIWTRWLLSRQEYSNMPKTPTLRQSPNASRKAGESRRVQRLQNESVRTASPRTITPFFLWVKHMSKHPMCEDKECDCDDCDVASKCINRYNYEECCHRCDEGDC